MTSQSAWNVSETVDLDRYPIADLTSQAGEAFADQCKLEYQQNGLCKLPGFIQKPEIARLAKEARAASEHAYFCDNTHNAYLTNSGAESGKHDNDPETRQEKTYVGSVPYDRIEHDARLKALYQWPPLCEFIGHVLGKSSLYRFADPFGALSINVFVDGGQHGWHFDESEFTVTLMLQKPASGGQFEFVPQIRGLNNERQIVASILDGEEEGVRQLDFEPGTLLIFAGRQSLHRVTRMAGETARLVPVLCFSEQPDQTNSEAVRQLFWGRSGPEA